MTRMEQAGRRSIFTPQIAAALGALAGAAVVGSAVVVANIAPFDLPAPVERRYEAPAAVIESGQSWEAQRRQQMVTADGLTQSGRDWEEQRRDQMVTTDAVTDSGQEWEEQRRQQSVD